MDIFCKIIKHKAPATIVYENKYTMAIFDIQPASPGHTLILPRKHEKYPSEETMKTIGIISTRILKKYNYDAIRIVYMAKNKYRDIKHPHWHIIGINNKK